jgi:cytochrome c-type biogenesis protein CcmH/NrfG
MQLAILYADLGKAALSVSELELVVGLAPDMLGARQMLARAYAGQGEKQKAAAQWEAVLRLDPSNREAKQALAVEPTG